MSPLRGTKGARHTRAAMLRTYYSPPRVSIPVVSPTSETQAIDEEAAGYLVI